MEMLAGPCLTRCKHLSNTVRVCSQVSAAEMFMVLSNDRSSAEVADV